jgi:hypothetical protein
MRRIRMHGRLRAAMRRSPPTYGHRGDGGASVTGARDTEGMVMGQSPTYGHRGDGGASVTGARDTEGTVMGQSPTHGHRGTVMGQPGRF